MNYDSVGSLDVLNLLTQDHGTVLLLTHRQADSDAVGAIIAMHWLITYLNPNNTPIAYLPTTNKLALALLAYSSLPLRDEVNDIPELTIIVDTSNPDLLELHPSQYTFNRVLIIDHHEPSPSLSTYFHPHMYHDSRTPSTCQLIMKLFYELKAMPPSKIGTCLLAGHLFDSRRFLSINQESFPLVQWLLDHGVNYDDALSLFQDTVDESERIARLKAAQRARWVRVADLIVVVSHVGSYEASAASALLQLGADISLVVSKRKDVIRVSTRGNYRVPETVDLSVIMTKLARSWRGTGGGHKKASGMQIPLHAQAPKVEQIKNTFLHALKQLLQA